MIIREALAAACAVFKTAGIDTPSLDASLLLAHVLKISRASAAALGTEPLSQENLNEFLALVERRQKGECAAYIIGKKEFRCLEFSVNPSVLVPRPDTETLVEAAISVINEQIKISNEKAGSYDVSSANSIRVLDLCTGSGAVAVSLKNEMPCLEVHASDISGEALETAKENARRLLGENQIHFYHSDLCDALPRSLFSLIVSNPPYIPSGEIQTLSAEVQNEPRLALDGGKAGLEIISRIIDSTPDFLKRGGFLLLEADPRQMEKIASVLAGKGFYDIKLFKDLSGRERVIGGIFA
jgi:release factor glutamine methyltransferase